MKKLIFACALACSLFLSPIISIYADEDGSIVPVEETEPDVVEDEAIIEDYEFLTTWVNLKNYVEENYISPDSAVVVNGLWLVSLKLSELISALGYVTALLLLLSLFEVWRVVRSWSKGVNIK